MFSQLLALAALAVVVHAEYWIFGGTRPIVTTRLDPVINPGQLGTHVHSVVGASRFKNVYDPDDLTKSNCTTIPVQPDKSSYWSPQLYHQDQQTGQFTPIPTSFNIYYLMRSGPKNESIKAFPPGLRMVAGDTFRRTYNASSFADQAITFVCLDFSGAHNGDPDWAERPSFFDHNCPQGMRAQVFFPSCWDGVNLDSPDHKSHMAYPTQNFNTGDCPDTHPVHLVSLFYEMFVSVDQFDYWGPGTWVLANGDTTGYGHHGDFENGWDVDLLQDAVDNCPNANGNVMDCPPLAAAFDQASADACVLETQIVDEPTGFDGPLSQLPGCNPLWDGTGPRPTCAATPGPALVPVQTPLPANWTEMGCIAEGTNGRALVGASMTSPNMTRALCASFCFGRGFALAGTEYSEECYCDNEMRNGATNETVTWNECKNRCAGNDNEICGGPMRLTLMVTSSLPPDPIVAETPAGWTALGCMSDVPARALTGFSFANNNMTVKICASTCAARGFSIAGVEYGRECYCGNSFHNDGGKLLDESSCNSVCAGDPQTTCGGGLALSTFELLEDSTTTTAVSVPASSTLASSAPASSAASTSSEAAPSPSASSVSSSAASSASTSTLTSSVVTSSESAASTPSVSTIAAISASAPSSSDVASSAPLSSHAVSSSSSDLVVSSSAQSITSSASASSVQTPDATASTVRRAYRPRGLGLMKL